MTQTAERRPGGRGGAQKTAGEDVRATVPQPDDTLWDPDHWTSFVEWWLSPALAYAAGLADGARLERDRIDRENEQLHRDAVRAALAHISVVDRRRLADAGVSA